MGAILPREISSDSSLLSPVIAHLLHPVGSASSQRLASIPRWHTEALISLGLGACLLLQAEESDTSVEPEEEEVATTAKVATIPLKKTARRLLRKSDKSKDRQQKPKKRQQQHSQ